MKKSKVLVTGGAGFIGSNLVVALAKRKFKVVVLDNLYTGSLQNLEPVLNKIEFVKCDIRSEKDVKKNLKDVDYVFHLAAIPSVIRSFEKPSETWDVNVCGTLNLLECSVKANIKRFIFASSSSVYGEANSVTEKIRATRETQTTMPVSPYGVSKLMAEQYTMVYHRVYNVDVVIFRLFNVFGLRQDEKSEYSAVIPRFISAIINNKQPVIYGDGLQSRDFTFIDNVVYFFMRCLSKKNFSERVFNLGCGKTTSLLVLINILEKISNKKVTPLFQPPRPGDIRFSKANISRLKKEFAILDERKFFTLEYGLKKTLKFFEQKYAKTNQGRYK